ncbi:ATP-binding protein [Mariniphaga sp.]|uniref:PAS domain-containing sensor histidine kinase n=1 Tax=Mariniphaga sp. TaxID=1954475 RepID=UPI0035617F4C
MPKKPTYKELEFRIKELQLESEERFRQLIKNSFDMIVLIGADGIQHYVSESCEKILGYKPEELTNIPVIEKMIHPDDREKTMQGLLEIVAKKGVGGVQYRHRHKNGSWVYLEAFGTNQLDNPAVQSVVLNVRDITERKHIEQVLKESEARLSEMNATKDKFFSIIAHDLKSPFNSILGFSELLAEQVQKGDYNGIEKYASVIQHSSGRAMELLTNLLEWARSQTGRMEFQPEFFELNVLVKEVLALLENVAQQKSITIINNLPGILPVFADRKMVGTILRNLISNGIKFTHRGGEIRISSQENDGKMVVSVSDSGVGISREVLEKLFRIEENYTTAGTKNEKGTGLGLLLCKEFVEMHGGKIWVESEVGNGSTFRFSLQVSTD